MSASWFRPFSLRGRRILSHWRTFVLANAWWTWPADRASARDLPPNAWGGGSDTGLESSGRGSEGTPAPHDAGGIPRGEHCAADTHGQNTCGWRFRLAASRGDPRGRCGRGAQRQCADGPGGGPSRSVTALC